ncbi:MAG: hypothetical protein ACOVN0_06545 [Niveispirillum sp.]|uniref:RHS repeat domain-containing protein n=1 Tax=Niveispirillum sp. TaxID=1917217 RepID=UPI003BA792BE
MPGIPHAVTATLYTATDQPQSVTDPLGRVTVTDYDALDRPYRVTTPWEAGQKLVEKSAVGTEIQQNSARYFYNPDGSIATITDPRGNVLAHAYDWFERLSILSYADGRTESYGGACPGLDPGTKPATAQAPPGRGRRWAGAMTG